MAYIQYALIFPFGCTPNYHTMYCTFPFGNIINKNTLSAKGRKDYLTKSESNEQSLYRVPTTNLVCSGSFEEATLYAFLAKISPF